MHRLRKLFPPSGARYELFNCSVFLLALGVIGYMVTTPPAYTIRALSGPLAFADDTVWGSLLAGAALVGILFSYLPGAVRAGYVIVASASSFWALNLAVGIAFYEPSLRACVTCLIYCFLTRQLVHEASK